MQDSIVQKLVSLYGEEKGKATSIQLESLIKLAQSKITPSGKEFWDEKDVFLITYPDSFTEKNAPTLKTLSKFLDLHLSRIIDGVHILPFFPYSSDRGFSVVDYYKVEPKVGSWEDIRQLSKQYRLMADIVLNHVSTKSEWFQKFLQGDEKYWDYFIHFRKNEIPEVELKKVYRPRATPLLTRFSTKKGERWVWTTFSVEKSTDQVDLNYKNPLVLQEIVQILLFYLKKGIWIFRLDAVPFVWKEVGTNCWSLPQVHTIISLLRDILDIVCPSALIVSQSSASLEENLSYFGSQSKESQIIYNFALPPLTLHAFYAQKNNHLNALAANMNTPRENCTFYNVLALHDGIGISGAKGFLSDEELHDLFNTIKEHGGLLSYRTMPDGSENVVEMNSTWWSALNREDETYESKKNKFITSQAILLALKGIPLLYYISLFGLQNDLELYKKTGIKRDINRSIFELGLLEAKLKNQKSKEADILKSLLELIKKRKQIKAFHPNAEQKVINLDSRIFTILRESKKERILALHNLSNDRVEVKYEGKEFILTPFSFLWERI